MNKGPWWKQGVNWQNVNSIYIVRDIPFITSKYSVLWKEIYRLIIYCCYITRTFWVQSKEPEVHPIAKNSKRSCNIEILDNWYRVSIMHAYVFWKNPDKVTRCQLSVSLSKRYEAREKFPRKYFGCFSGLWIPTRRTVEKILADICCLHAAVVVNL